MITARRRWHGGGAGGRRLWPVAALALVCSACSAPRAEERPALLVDPSPAARAELERTVREALHGAAVVLAEDALTRSSLLAVERPAPRDIEQRPLTGRVLEPPQRFRLVLSDSRCVLVHVDSGTRHPLAEATCRPE